MISLNWRFFAEDTKNDPKMHSYGDNAQFCSVFSATLFTYATGFRQKQEVIEYFEYLGKFEQDF
jgi:hypothetical protein